MLLLFHLNKFKEEFIKMKNYIFQVSKEILLSEQHNLRVRQWKISAARYLLRLLLDRGESVWLSVSPLKGNGID